MRARIYQPARNAMQSGQANANTWILEYAPTATRQVDPLMGWTSSGDMNSQVKISFDTLKEAERYAKDHGLEWTVAAAHKRQHVIRQGGYAENFATNRRRTWTH